MKTTFTAKNDKTYVSEGTTSERPGINFNMGSGTIDHVIAAAMFDIASRANKKVQKLYDNQNYFRDKVKPTKKAFKFIKALVFGDEVTIEE